MPNTSHDVETLLAEIERLKLENAILRKAAGIHLASTSNSHQVDVTPHISHPSLKNYCNL